MGSFLHRVGRTADRPSSPNLGDSLRHMKKTKRSSTKHRAAIKLAEEELRIGAKILGMRNRRYLGPCRRAPAGE